MQPEATLLSTNSPARGSAAAPVDLTHLPGLDLRRADDGWHGLWRAGGIVHQFWLAQEPSDTIAAYTATLPLEETGFSLNDETRFPFSGDWRTDFSPATGRRYATSSPGTALSQQTRGDVQADLQQLDAFQRGTTVADMVREIPEHASPNDGAAS